MPNQPEEWYYDKEWLGEAYNERGYRSPDLPRIVAEADRRATVRTWEEAKKILEEIKPEELPEEKYDEDSQCRYCASFDPDCGCEAVEAITDSLLEGVNSRIQQYGKQPD